MGSILTRDSRLRYRQKMVERDPMSAMSGDVARVIEVIDVVLITSKMVMVTEEEEDVAGGVVTVEVAEVGHTVEVVLTVDQDLILEIDIEIEEVADGATLALLRTHIHVADPEIGVVEAVEEREVIREAIQGREVEAGTEKEVRRKEKRKIKKEKRIENGGIDLILEVVLEVEAEVKVKADLRPRMEKNLCQVITILVRISAMIWKRLKKIMMLLQLLLLLLMLLLQHQVEVQVAAEVQVEVIVVRVSGHFEASHILAIV